MVNQEYYKIGQKIRNFRKRAGLSQLQLETQIGMSPGGLSRIENGEVSPMKETIAKISSELTLNFLETYEIMGLELSSNLKQAKESFKIVESFDLFKVERSKAVGVVIVEILKQIDNLPDSMVSRIALKEALPSKRVLTQFLLSDLKNNMTTRSVVEDKVFLSNDISEFISPPVSRESAIKFQVVNGIKSEVSIPIHQNNEVIGVVNIAFDKAAENIKVDSVHEKITTIEEFFNFINVSVYD
jgi:transcriptional regulator with XRE-family HTH domain